MLTRTRVLEACRLVERSESTNAGMRPGWVPCRMPGVLDTLRESAADGWLEIDEASERPKYSEAEGAGWVRLTPKGRAALDLFNLPA